MDSTLRQAIDLQKSGHTESAITLLQQASHHGDPCAHTQHFLGLLLQITGRNDEAETALRVALRINPNLQEAWLALGNLLRQCQKEESALHCFRQSTNMAPDSVDAWMQRSALARRMGLYEESLECATQAVTLDPKNPKIWLGILSALGFLKRYKQGIQVAQEAAAIFPKEPEILSMLGNMMTASGRQEDALSAYQIALSLAPENPLILNALGSLHSNHSNAMDAIPLHLLALKQNPNSPEALLGMGSAWLRAGNPNEALRYLEQALNVGQESYDAFDGMLLAMQYLEDQDESKLFSLHREWNDRYATKLHPHGARPLPALAFSSQRPLKVGFVSPDLHNHSVARFITPLFRHWDLTGFERFVYSDVRSIDRVSEKMQALGGRWCFTLEMTDQALAEQIRTDGIDILVDLAGHTGNHRLLVFAQQPAPIQVSWLGYPNTTGLDAIAFRLSDAIADPPGRSDELSSEALVRMEQGFHCFEPLVSLPAVNEAPVLSSGKLTFGSFNNLSKITNLTLNRWSCLLHRIPGSRLILKNPQLQDPRNRAWMTDRLNAFGIEPNRLELFGFLPETADHYALYQQIDIALDTFPYNGTTTTCEALWMGVPVMTWIGEHQRSRTSASLLTHAGLSDWITDNESSWLNLAITQANNPSALNQLRQGLRSSLEANNPSALNQLRQGLRSSLEASPIGDGKSFALRFAKTLLQLSENRI